jgi:hypothetical protein
MDNIYNQPMNRIETLTKIVSNKRIIHFGFADNGAEYKIKEGLWLHSHLYYSARACIGVDLSYEGNYPHVIWDVENEIKPMALNGSWDYIILGEVIEHVDNPVNFLKSIIKNFPGVKLIITVPNAFRLRNFITSLWNREEINPDHRYWFTPATIFKVCECSGYKVEKIDIINSFNRGLITGLFLSVFKQFRDTILVR